MLQKALGDFAVTYEINVYCDTPALMPRLYTALHRNILDVFNEYGVQIMTPAYEGDPDRAEARARARTGTRRRRRRSERRVVVGARVGPWGVLRRGQSAGPASCSVGR